MIYVCPYCTRPMPEALEVSEYACCSEVGHCVPADSDTPRTDAFVLPAKGWTGLEDAAEQYNRLLGFARQLEREIRALREATGEPVAWYRVENGLRVYYETEAWPNMTPLYSSRQRGYLGSTTDGGIDDH